MNTLILSIRREQGNTICPDCLVRAPSAGFEDVCLYSLSFLCHRCALVHQRKGLKMLSVASPELTDDVAVAFFSFEGGGNDNCIKKYMNHPDVETLRPCVNASYPEFEFFVLVIYVQKRYFLAVSPPMNLSDSTMNESFELLDSDAVLQSLQTDRMMQEQMDSLKQENQHLATVVSTLNACAKEIEDVGIQISLEEDAGPAPRPPAAAAASAKDSVPKADHQALKRRYNDLLRDKKKLSGCVDDLKDQMYAILEKSRLKDQRIQRLQSQLETLQSKRPAAAKKKASGNERTPAEKPTKPVAQSSRPSDPEADQTVVDFNVMQLERQLEVQRGQREQLQSQLDTVLNLDLSQERLITLEAENTRMRNQLLEMRQKHDDLLRDHKELNSLFEQLNRDYGELSGVAGTSESGSEAAAVRKSIVELLSGEVYTEEIESMIKRYDELHQTNFDRLVVLLTQQALVGSLEFSFRDQERVRELDGQLRSSETRWAKEREDLIRDYESQIRRIKVSQREDVDRQVEDFRQRLKLVVMEYKREMELRKMLFNELIELKGNIRVFCRVRPQVSSDRIDPGRPYISIKDQSVTLSIRPNCQRFEFDGVFDQTCSQEDVFQEIAPYIRSALDGYPLTIFAYGQTGSGKTYTMEGPSSDPGVNYRAIQLLLDAAESERNHTYKFSISILEVYNEKIQDLIEPLSKREKTELAIHLNEEGRVFVKGLKRVYFSSYEEVTEICRKASRNRETRGHILNERSSRSHLILSVYITQMDNYSEVTKSNCVNLIDLAGSERILKTGVEGKAREEAVKINSSLSALGTVIHSLGERAPHIPYRNNKLTHILQDSLRLDAKVLLIVTVPLFEAFSSETSSSLTFGERCREVELGLLGRGQAQALFTRIRNLTMAIEDEAKQTDPDLLYDRVQFMDYSMAANSTVASTVSAAGSPLNLSRTRRDSIHSSLSSARKETRSVGPQTGSHGHHPLTLSSLNGTIDSSPPMRVNRSQNIDEAKLNELKKSILTISRGVTPKSSTNSL